MIDLASFLLLAFDAAQATPPAEAAPPAGGGGGGFLSSPMLPMIVTLVLVMIFFQTRPNQDKKQKQLIDSLKKNDRVVTAGGIYGIIANVKPDADEIVLKIDEDKDVKITVMKSAILRKESSEQETKDKAEAK